MVSDSELVSSTYVRRPMPGFFAGNFLRYGCCFLRECIGVRLVECPYYSRIHIVWSRHVVVEKLENGREFWWPILSCGTATVVGIVFVGEWFYILWRKTIFSIDVGSFAGESTFDCRVCFVRWYGSSQLVPMFKFFCSHMCEMNNVDFVVVWTFHQLNADASR